MPPTGPLSLTGARWRIPEASSGSSTLPSHLSAWLTDLITARWPDSPPPVWEPPSWDHFLDPHDLLNMDAALKRLDRARAQGERIRVVTDYDVDGTTSSLILQAALALTAPNCTLDYHIPNRFGEGYGFSVQAAEAAADDGVSLIVTADIGVRDHAAAAAARARGVDVLICDHHLPAGADVPSDAIVLCPPQRECTYGNPHLAACGVSFKLAQALLHEHPKRDAILRSLLKLAAIGTVADLVPLTSLENRAIVTLGLEALNHDRHNPGLTALLDVAGAQPGEIDSQVIGFRIGPRINAAGRLDDAQFILRMLQCRDPQQAQEMARELDNLNRRRQTIQRQVEQAALKMVPESPPEFVVVSGKEEDGWHRGVVGIVASRLKDQLNRPCAVVSIQGDRAVGSVRSVKEVHAVHALESASDLLEKFGGHPAAAGFTVPTDKLEELATRLTEAAKAQLSGSDWVVEREVDITMPSSAIDMALLQDLELLGPFGMGNPVPRLVIPDVRAQGIRRIGKDRSHLKFSITTGGRQTDCIWFGQGELAEQLEGCPIDLLVTLGRNTWRGVTRLQCLVQDARVAAG